MIKKIKKPLEFSVDGSVMKTETLEKTICYKLTENFAIPTHSNHIEISREEYDEIYNQVKINDEIEFRKAMFHPYISPLTKFITIPGKWKFWKNWDCMNDPEWKKKK